MVSGIWRRLRSLFPAASPPADAGQQPAPSEPPSSFYAPPEPPRPPVETAPTPPPPEPPRSVEQLAESFGTRLVEDEALRGSLTDDEFQPLLDWANARL